MTRSTAESAPASESPGTSRRIPWFAAATLASLAGSTGSTPSWFRCSLRVCCNPTPAAVPTASRAAAEATQIPLSESVWTEQLRRCRRRVRTCHSRGIPVSTTSPLGRAKPSTRISSRTGQMNSLSPSSTSSVRKSWPRPAISAAKFPMKLNITA